MFKGVTVCKLYKDAIIFANKVGGISTTRLGAASSMPLLKEVEEY